MIIYLLLVNGRFQTIKREIVVQLSLVFKHAHIVAILAAEIGKLVLQLFDSGFLMLHCLKK